MCRNVDWDRSSEGAAATLRETALSNLGLFFGIVRWNRSVELFFWEFFFGMFFGIAPWNCFWGFVLGNCSVEARFLSELRLVRRQITGVGLGLTATFSLPVL